jgi:NTE family protein
MCRLPSGILCKPASPGADGPKQVGRCHHPSFDAEERVKVGLVLGAGGVMGGAWLTGGLEALARETGWDPASADRIVGTSAGAMMGSLLAAGVPPWFMVAHSAGETFPGLVDSRGRPAEQADRSGGAIFRLHRGGGLRLGPGSWRLALNSLSRPRRHSPAALVSGWLPRGFISTGPLRDTIRRVVPSGWVDREGLWVVACDYENGRRTMFGREDAPTADLADAVAASCAIPGFYHPVRINGRNYVDGGMWSTSNLDVVVGQRLDLVICLNPTSSLHPTHAWNPADRLAGVLRGLSGRRLGSEARLLREEGTTVVLIQPLGEDLAAMGPNLMSTRGRQRVIEVASRTVGQQIRESEERDVLDQLPPGEPEKLARPAGPPETWPQIRPVAAG